MKTGKLILILLAVLAGSGFGIAWLMEGKGAESARAPAGQNLEADWDLLSWQEANRSPRPDNQPSLKKAL